ncbi:hypothetical protein RUND412_010716 [Rhizina undulata]
MERLPLEILQEIVGYLPEQDLNSVRLVNHGLSAVANVLKYRVLRVRVSRQGLDHLLYVSQQPALARRVREIIYPWHHLRPLLEPDADADLDDVEIESSTLEEYFQLASNFLEWYNKTIYAAQLELENSGECVDTLEAALSRMSNVRVLSPGICIMDLSDEFCKWRGTLADSGRYNIDMDWNVIWESILFTPIWTEPDELVGGHFLELIVVSDRVGLKPDELGSTIHNQSGPLLWFAFWEDNFGMLQNCTSLLKNLTSLTLVVDEYGVDDYEDKNAFGETFQNEEKLHLFLSSASNLRYLSLALHIHHLLANRYLFSLLDIVGRACTWKYLHTFRFEGPDVVKSEQLVHFLSCHSETLEALYLSFLYPVTGFRSLLDFVKEVLHLTKFELKYSICELLESGRSIAYSREQTDRMQDYVLHGDSSFLIPEVELEEES